MTRASGVWKQAQSTVTFWALCTALLLFAVMYLIPNTISHWQALMEEWSKPDLVAVESPACYGERPIVLAYAIPPVKAPPPLYSPKQLRYVQQFTDKATAEKVLLAVHKVSAKRGIDPRIVLAIIQPESHFKPRAISPNGYDHGLMQVRVKFHRDRMKRLGVTNILDIESNVKTGVDIFVEYKQAAKGNILRALTRYNGGSESRARRVISLAHRIPA